jgi:hypothetical protein
MTTIQFTAIITTIITIIQLLLLSGFQLVFLTGQHLAQNCEHFVTCVWGGENMIKKWDLSDKTIAANRLQHQQ